MFFSEVSEPLKEYCKDMKIDNEYESSKHKLQLPEHINSLKLTVSILIVTNKKFYWVIVVFKLRIHFEKKIQSLISLVLF